MHYPVMTERQIATRWKISVKTVRRWRTTGCGPRWHKLFKLVRYHRADVLEFERRGAQFWTTILDDGECIPKVVRRPPKDEDTSSEEVDVESVYLTVKEILEATGLPLYWLNDPKVRATKRIPHLALVGNVRFSLDAIWQWELATSTVGNSPVPKPPQQENLKPEPSGPAPRWYEVVDKMNNLAVTLPD